ncbi:MAG TPA: Maf family protein [Methylophilaceae bacterium]|jgi:septum formation protein
MPKIYLASRSPRRGEILRQIGVDFEVLPSDIDESVFPGEAPEQYVVRLAREKAMACIHVISRRGLPVMSVLAADTTVCVDSEILGKPENDEHAAAMLRMMSGRWHTTHTGVAVAHGDKIEMLLSSTQVEMRSLTEAEIAAYVASGESEGKAGAYGIQGLAGSFISRIEGSYSGVMGLPVFETAQLLNKFGIEVL